MVSWECNVLEADHQRNRHAPMHAGYGALFEASRFNTTKRSVLEFVHAPSSPVLELINTLVGMINDMRRPEWRLISDGVDGWTTLAMTLAATVAYN